MRVKEVKKWSWKTNQRPPLESAPWYRTVFPSIQSNRKSSNRKSATSKEKCIIFQLNAWLLNGWCQGASPKEPYKEISADGEDWRIIRNLHMNLFNSHRDQHSSPLPSQKPYASVSDCGLKELMQPQPLPSSFPRSFNPLPCSRLPGEKDLTTRRAAEAGSRGRHPQGNFHSVLSVGISNLPWPFAPLLPISCNYRLGIFSCAHTGVDLHAAKNLWVSDINSEERQCLCLGGFWCVEPSPEFLKEKFPKIILNALWLFDKKLITFPYNYLEQNVHFISFFSFFCKAQRLFS